MKERLNVLVLSSRLPSYSADYGRDLIKSLTNAGHFVQFGFQGLEEEIVRCTRLPKDDFFRKVYKKIYYVVRKYFNGLCDILPFKSIFTRKDMAIYHLFEDRPPLSVDKVMGGLTGSYDLCIILFYHNMFTTKTYKAIYEKFHCPIVLIGIDMMHMTGGCYYFGECRNFEHECGNCPILGGLYRNDQTHKNYLYKKNVYDSIECVFCANTWQLDYARKSRLFENAKLKKINLVLDENIYAPRDIYECRNKFNIPKEKKYIFLSRYRNILRKGMDILIDGVNNLYDSLSEEDKSKTLLLLIGEKSDNVRDIFMMDVMQLGFVGKEDLIDAYNASSAFLCSSTDDAGPSMINQSMACGTPVIAFDIGNGVDMIDDGLNGFKAPITEKCRWADGLKKLCALDDEQYEEIRRQARKKAVEINGLEAFSKEIEDIYKDFRPVGKQ